MGTIAELKPDLKNARKHSRRNIDMLVDSLHEVGAARSIVIDEEDMILAGHGVIEAAGLAGIERMRVIEADGNEIIAVRRSGLSETQKRKLSLYDNRVAELADWDPEILAGLVADDEDLLAGVFSADELVELLKNQGNNQGEPPAPQIDKAEELREKWGVLKGQLWEIPSKTVDGSHRILCGDSTSEADVARLTAHQKVGVVFTDPPYGIQYDSASTGRTKQKWTPVVGDEHEGEALQAFYQTVLRIAVSTLKPNGVLYVCCASTKAHHLIAAAEHLGIHYAVPLVWVKQSFSLTWDRYRPQHEIIFYGGPGSMPTGKLSRWYGPKNETTVWQVDTDPHGDYQHPTQKPTELARRALRNSSVKGELALDLFLGSGCTMAAAEQLGRVCYGCDIEPKYVAVTLERLADMGLEPRLTVRRVG